MKIKKNRPYSYKTWLAMMAFVLLLMCAFSAREGEANELVTPVPESAMQIFITATPTPQPVHDQAVSINKQPTASPSDAFTMSSGTVRVDQAPTKAEIVSYIMEIFGQTSTEAGVDAITCFYSESGLRPEAVNNGNSNGTSDYGVPQINSVHFKRYGDSFKYARNWREQIEIAYEIFKSRDNTFEAWYGSRCR